VWLIVHAKTLTFANSAVHKLTVTVQKSILVVNLEVTAPGNSISPKQLKEVQKLLQQKFKKPVTLKV
jgi:F0F1-type ATP synthase delta subunit